MAQRSSYSEQDETPQYWFNERTGLVEVGPQSVASYRIGPFATRAEAEQALRVVADRAAAMRKQDDEDDWS